MAVRSAINSYQQFQQDINPVVNSRFPRISNALNTIKNKFFLSAEDRQRIDESLQLARELNEAKAQLEMITNRLRGSMVKSKTEEEYQKWNEISGRNEIWELYAAYEKVDRIYLDPNIKAANKKLTRGACKKFSLNFSPAKKNPESRAAAKNATEATKAFVERLNGNGWAGNLGNYKIKGFNRPQIADVAEQGGKYQNGFLELAWEKDNSLADMAILPPYTWQVNNDDKFEFYEGQEDCYVYFDPANRQVQTKLSADRGVFYSIGKEIDQRYAFPNAIALQLQVDGLHELYRGLPDARSNSFPERVYLRDGTAINYAELKKFWDSLPEQRLARGETISPEQWFRILSGYKDAKVLSSGTGYFNEFGDHELYRDIIAMANDLQLAMITGAEKVNRSTLEFVNRLLAMAQRMFAFHLTNVLIYPACVIICDKLKIKTNLIYCEAEWSEEWTPEELKAKAEFALKIQESDSGIKLAEKNTHRLYCQYLDIDAEADIRQKEDEEREKIESGKYVLVPVETFQQFQCQQQNSENGNNGNTNNNKDDNGKGKINNNILNNKNSSINSGKQNRNDDQSGKIADTILDKMERNGIFSSNMNT